MLKIKALASKFNNCFTFQDLREYIKENVDNNKLSYENLKIYIIKNLLF